MTEPLWEAAEQAARLAELTAAESPLKEEPLRRDVRSLGRLLGEVLREQGGARLFDAVEELRQLAIQHRELHAHTPADTADLPDEHELMTRAREIVGALDVTDAYHLTRAFATYFELTNLAETNHRKRRRRAAEVAPQHPAQPGSFLGTLRRLRDEGL